MLDKVLSYDQHEGMFANDVSNNIFFPSSCQQFVGKLYGFCKIYEFLPLHRKNSLTIKFPVLGQTYFTLAS